MATPRSRAPAATRSWTRRLSPFLGGVGLRCAGRRSGARGRRRAMREPPLLVLEATAE